MFFQIAKDWPALYVGKERTQDTQQLCIKYGMRKREK